MNVKDLIKLLEKKLEEHKPHEPTLGELGIGCDVFKKDPDVKFSNIYAGISNKIIIEQDVDGQLIISAFAEDHA